MNARSKTSEQQATKTISFVYIYLCIVYCVWIWFGSRCCRYVHCTYLLRWLQKAMEGKLTIIQQQQRDDIHRMNTYSKHKPCRKWRHAICVLSSRQELIRFGRRKHDNSVSAPGIWLNWFYSENKYYIYIIYRFSFVFILVANCFQK